MDKTLPYEHVNGPDCWDSKKIPNLLITEGKNPLYNKVNSIWMPWKLCEMSNEQCKSTCGNRVNFKNKNLRPSNMPERTKIKKHSYLPAWDQSGEMKYH